MQTRTALRIREEEDERVVADELQSKKVKGKEREAVPPPSTTVLQAPIEEVSKNLRTVEFAVRIVLNTEPMSR